MELVFISMLFIISLSALLTPSASLQIQLQSSHKQAEAANNKVQVSLPTLLPRKLRFTEKVVGQQGKKDSATYNKQNENALAGSNKPKSIHKEEESGQVVQRNRGTWQEWMEGEDTSEFFTMDYTKVKRRRPIHNKSRPVSP